MEHRYFGSQYYSFGPPALHHIIVLNLNDLRTLQQTLKLEAGEVGSGNGKVTIQLVLEEGQ